MLSDDEINDYRSRIAEIAVKGIESALSEEYQRTMDATTHLRHVVDDATDYGQGLRKAAAAVRDARPAIPEDLVEEWDDIADELEEAVE